MTRILFYLDDHSHSPWRQALKAADPSVDVRSYPDWGSPDDGPAYAFVWEPKPGLLKAYPNITAIFSMGAGVDHILKDPERPKGVPIIRMGDDSLKEGMAEFLAMNILWHHRRMPQIQHNRNKQEWRHVIAKAAKNVRVGIMGYGTLGKEAARVLKPFGYDLAAWSLNPKPAEDGITHYSGADSLPDFLARTDIVASLLPATEATTNLLNKETMSLMPEKAVIINAGRGNLINLSDLEHMINTGHIAGATLDVFPQEPLPAEHPLWRNDNVIITPHIAAITRPDSAAEYVIKNIRRIEAGEEPENKLDLSQGY